ncbi:elongator complex 6 [Brachionus plicatilis]|uniref:Elongator complex protein 6 n=1 Tax=Brachionus plicatilis TaxID=10195 RepID=A0A3M7QY99_BRAPC|nr:elongator complex 6 [Brachionus plicatilis]
MDFNTVIEFGKEKSSFYLVDSSTDGSFFIHYILSHSIRSNVKTIFVTLSQTLGHYKGVQAKLGNSTSLSTSLSERSLVHYDLLSKISQAYVEGKSDQIKIFDDLVDKVAAVVQQKDEDFILIIDDLCLACLNGVSEKALFGFLAKIQSLSDKLCLVVYAQSMLATRDFINDLIYMSDLYFKIENLSTGYSKEIDGQMSVFRMNEDLNLRPQKYLYKVNERNVKLFQI